MSLNVALVLSDAAYDLGLVRFHVSLRPCECDSRYVSGDAVYDLGFGRFVLSLLPHEFEARFAS